MPSALAGSNIAIGEAHQKIRTVGEREAQQLGGVRIVGEGRRHHGKNLPEEKNWPEEDGEVFGFILRDEVPGESGGSGEAAESAEGEGEVSR